MNFLTSHLLACYRSKYALVDWWWWGWGWRWGVCGVCVCVCVCVWGGGGGGGGGGTGHDMLKYDGIHIRQNPSRLWRFLLQVTSTYQLIKQ